MINNFNTVAKPGGNLCNLAVDYCFYLENDAPRPACAAMDDKTLETYIRNTIISTPSESVDFYCHGSCPKHRIIIQDNEAQNYLCAGYLAFFRHITPYMNVMRKLL